MMHAHLLSLALVVTAANPIFAIADEPDEKPITIPLDQVWAWQMPGTRDVATLEPDKSAKVAHGQLVYEIRRALANVPPKGTSARAGFAVAGTGLEALRDAHAVLVEHREPQQTFAPDNKLSIVFLSYSCSYYVHVKDASRVGRFVKVHYQFVPHKTKELTAHFALIPLPDLPVGDFHIEIIRSPMEPELIETDFQTVTNEFVRRIVCQSFSFSVEKLGSAK